jgi:hypothetical protein
MNNLLSRRLWIIALGLLLCTGLAGSPSGALAAEFLFPGTSYLQASDSPFYEVLPFYYLETFEDGLFNTPGVSVDHGAIADPHPSLTDSVDADDGLIDGYGRDGWCWYYDTAMTGLTFTFSAGQLGGRLPTHAGLVWTDGYTNSFWTFEAFGPDGASLGTLARNGFADGNNQGGTAEDRFFGVINLAGVSKIKIKGSMIGGIEVDHLQYGNAVPIPGSLLLLGSGLLGLGLLGRRRRYGGRG